MLEAGFTRVGEFHYIHHDVSGAPYGNIGELAERIAAAAEATGIGLTLLPVFYAHAGFGGRAPDPGQRRFINGSTVCAPDGGQPSRGGGAATARSSASRRIRCGR